MPDPTPPNESPYATREQIVVLVSRLFAAYLLFWVVSDLIDLPREILDVVHLFKQGFEMGTSALSIIKTSEITRRYMLILLASVLKIALWLMAAGWFYRCGPRIRNFFTAESDAASNVKNI